MADVALLGATYPDVPAILLPASGGGTARFDDTSDATATAEQILNGYTAYAGGAKLTGTAEPQGGGVWWGGVDAEFLYETEWSAALSDASNWPLTPKTTAQNLTWVTELTTTANANATIDRYGKGYHGVTETLDFGTWNYILFEDAFVDYAYTSPEASLGKVHATYGGFSCIYHWGARCRVASGSIIRPSATDYGTYGSCAYSVSLTGYRTAAGTFQMINNATYGVSAAAIAPSMNSTSSVKPSYFNIRTPTFGIRAHNTYMPVASYDYLVPEETTFNFKSKIYRVPVEYGAYTVINERLLDMVQQGALPA